MLDRTIYFDTVRASLFGGSMSQRQVEGQNDILYVWDWLPFKFPSVVLDLRWLAYMLATTFHETAQEMWPIEEYGKGGDAEYAEVDPQTGQAYYGRGFVQLTWRENYARADAELGLMDKASCEWYADNALVSVTAARIMFLGMYEGWFREDEKLTRYFGADVDDPYEAREIINGDKHIVPSWSHGVSIGNVIKSYHYSFLAALEAAQVSPLPPIPSEPPTLERDVAISSLTLASGTPFEVWVNTSQVAKGVAE